MVVRELGGVGGRVFSLSLSDASAMFMRMRNAESLVLERESLPWCRQDTVASRRPTYLSLVTGPAGDRYPKIASDRTDPRSRDRLLYPCNRSFPKLRPNQVQVWTRRAKT